MTFVLFICRSHKLEVQADVSETASAVTCISEKSGTASTKALAGSILNYKQAEHSTALSEDGASERVRFDNMIYVMEGQKDGDCWYTAPLDQVTFDGFPFTQRDPKEILSLCPSRT